MRKYTKNEPRSVGKYSGNETKMQRKRQRIVDERRWMREDENDSAVRSCGFDVIDQL